MTGEAKTEGAAGAMGLREYARHRGVSPAAVVKAIDNGRLVASVGRAESGARYITDAAIADREWAENTDPTRGPGSAREGETSLGDAAAREKVARAKLLELEYKEKTGVLVNAADVKAAIAQAITRARTNILAAPSKLKAARPNLTREDLAALDRILRESLEEVAEHEAPAQPAEVTSNDQNKAS